MWWGEVAAGFKALRKPPPSRRGGTLAVVTPSGAFDSERLQAGSRLLEGWGLQVPGPNTHRPYRYFAGTDPARSRTIEAALCDDAIAGLIAARGRTAVRPCGRRQGRAPGFEEAPFTS